jgi:hypothetical protein
MSGRNERLQRSDELMETVLAGFLQALEKRNQPANDPPELGFVGVHRRDARAQSEAFFEPGPGYGRALPPFALVERGHLAHLPDAGNAVYGGSTQQIRAFSDLDAGSEMQHVEQVAQGFVQPLVDFVDDLGVMRRLLDKENQIGAAEALHADGADPVFPDAEVGDGNGGHDPGSIGELERGRAKVGVDVIDGQQGELALVLKLVVQPHRQ